MRFEHRSQRHSCPHLRCEHVLQVLHCMDHRSGTGVALKIIRSKKRFQKQAAVEAGILELLRRRDPDDAANIVRSLEAFTFRGHLCITIELLSINLYEHIKACNFKVGRGVGVGVGGGMGGVQCGRNCMPLT